MEHEAHSLTGKDSRSWRLFVTIGLNLLITVFEVIGGILSGSLSVLSDALHNASDTLALVISYIAIRITRQPRSERYTFGLHRAEIIAALFNASVLIAICLWLVREAVLRLAEPRPLDGGLMAGIAAVALVANVAGTLLLRKGSGSSLNLRAVYFHLLSDAVTSLGVVLGGIAVALFDITWIDPVLTILISLWILKESWVIVREATCVIMMKAPGTVDLGEIELALKGVEGVVNIHHVHIWMMDEQNVFFEAHVDVEDMPLSRAIPLYDRLEKILRERFGIVHVTLQLEAERGDSKDLIQAGSSICGEG